MSSITNASELEDLKRRLEKIEEQRIQSLSDPGNRITSQDLASNVSAVVGALEKLTPQERAQLPLSEEDKERLRPIADLVARDKRGLIFQTIGVAGDDVERRAEFIRNKAKQGPDA